ncbi:hypothetical protein Tco_0698704 [Tanacetum coccineum]
MQRYNPFRCTCGKEDIILRTSFQPDIFGLQYYACPRSKPGTKNYGCGYFDWKDAFDERLMVSSSSTSKGSSGPYRSEKPQPSYSPGPYRSAHQQSSYYIQDSQIWLESETGHEGKTKDVGGMDGNRKGLRETRYHRMLAQELDASSGFIFQNVPLEVVLYALYLRCEIKSRLRTRVPSRLRLWSSSLVVLVDVAM